MTELLSCPFCGGRQTYRKHDGGVWLTTTNHKRGCIMRDALSFVAFGTEAEAIAAWNTRAERTCECVAEYAKSPIDGKTIVLHRCSACHELMRPHMAYCPNCGAKMVSAAVRKAVDAAKDELRGDAE